MSTTTHTPAHVGLYLLEGIDWLITMLDEATPKELADLKEEFKEARLARHQSGRPYPGLSANASLDAVVRRTGSHAQREISAFMESYFEGRSW